MNCIVHIVEDDPGMREALEDLLISRGLRVRAFATAEDYLLAPRPDVPSCLLLDLHLPGLNGLELQGRLVAGAPPPIVFISAGSDIESSVAAMKAGAMDFLPKPFSLDALLAAVEAGLARDRAARDGLLAARELRRRYESLTVREREVMALVAGGALNKQAAAQLGISIVTLQIHRGRVMRKMMAPSFAELVRMAGALDVPLSSSGLALRN